MGPRGVRGGCLWGARRGRDGWLETGAGRGRSSPAPLSLRAAGPHPTLTLKDGEEAVEEQVALGVVAELQGVGREPADPAELLLGLVAGRAVVAGVGQPLLAGVAGGRGLESRVVDARLRHRPAGRVLRLPACLPPSSGGAAPGGGRAAVAPGRRGSGLPASH